MSTLYCCMRPPPGIRSVAWTKAVRGRVNGTRCQAWTAVTCSDMVEGLCWKTGRRLF